MLSISNLILKKRVIIEAHRTSSMIILEKLYFYFQENIQYFELLVLIRMLCECKISGIDAFH
jgi:hypothetical protein